jgi:hypothetical protein
MFRIHRMLVRLAAVLACQLLPAFIYLPEIQTAVARSSDAQSIAAAYEESCVSNLRALNTAQALYRGGDPQKGYARSLKQLGPKGEDIIEPILASGRKSGYRFVLTPGPADAKGVINHYTISARPLKVLVKGQRSFLTDENGVIRSTREDRAAKASDPVMK